MFFASVGSRQEHVLPDIQRISSYFGAEYGSHYALGADVPDVNLSTFKYILVPASAYQEIGLIFLEFEGKYAVVVAGFVPFD